MTHEISVGDIIAFRGLEFLSQIIDFGTFGWGRGYSHVGIIAGHKSQPNLLLWESSYGNATPCVVAGKKIDGVQAHQIKEIFDRNAEVYHFPLSTPLTLKQQITLEKTLDTVHKRPYDYLGAFRAGGKMWAKVQAFIHGENFDEFFCDELVGYCFESIGVISEDIKPGSYSPNSFMKYLTKQKIVGRRTRLK